MSAPLPPSPPLGPPRGTYFSLRKARQPLPPSPALTRILTSSMNMFGQTSLVKPVWLNKEKPPLRFESGGSRELPWVQATAALCDCRHADELAHPAAVFEFHHAR